MDRIRWINHAGFELQTSGLRIVCDPWLSGRAFNNSWALLAETNYKPTDFAGVDYLWLSHEHPDHFSPRDLRSIPPEIRSGITVLFQRTADGRVVRFLRELGFKEVRELVDFKRTELGEGVFITSKSVGDDSLCFIETPQFTYLNLNDCVPPDAATFHRNLVSRFGSPDVLLTQFSYANWTGNPGDQAKMQIEAERKIADMQMQINIYQPKMLVPFASFVWFCRHDNFHLNAGANRIRDVVEHFKTSAQCVELHPGDLLEVGARHDPAAAIEQYEADDRRNSKPLELDDEVVSADLLAELSKDHQTRIRRDNGIWSLWPLRMIGYIRPIRIHLVDLGRSVTYSMFSGIRWKTVAREDCDIELSSSWMAQMLKHGTGYDTLYISGCFTEINPGARIHLSRNFVVLKRNEHGQFFPRSFFDIGALKHRIAFAIAKRRGSG